MGAQLGDGEWNNVKPDVAPPDQTAQEELDKILEPLIPVLQDGEVYVAALKADLLALMYRETLAVIGEDEVEYSNLDGDAGYWEKHGRNGLRERQRQAAAKRYAQPEACPRCGATPMNKECKHNACVAVTLRADKE